MSTIWFVYGMNYAQNSILNDLIGAWNVCGKNSTNLDKPNVFSTDFDYWATKVNSGIGMEVMQEGR